MTGEATVVLYTNRTLKTFFNFPSFPFLHYIPQPPLDLSADELSQIISKAEQTQKRSFLKKKYQTTEISHYTEERQYNLLQI